MCIDELQYEMNDANAQGMFSCPLRHGISVRLCTYVCMYVCVCVYVCMYWYAPVRVA